MSTPEVRGVGEIVGGLALVVFAGILNGSWNAAFNPKLALAVSAKSTVQTVQLGRRETVLNSSLFASFQKTYNYDLDYHYAWMLFQLYAGIINGGVCILWAGGPSHIYLVLSQVSSTMAILALTTIIPILWGIGIVLFGVACKIAGVGLGTSLRIGVICVIGTFIPLAYYGTINTATGGIIIAGLAVVCVGLFFSAESLRIRDLDVAKAKEQQLHQHHQHQQRYQQTNNVSSSSGSVPNADSSYDICKESKQDDTELNQLEQNNIDGDNHISCNMSITVSPSERATATKRDNTFQNSPPEYSTFVKVSVCLIGGILASLIQVTFIFGQDIMHKAQSDGNTPIGGSAAIIWLFTVSIGCIPSIIYGFYTSPKEIPLKTIWLCPWWRHFFIMLTSVTYVAPIHLYGLTVELLLPPEFAASIAWPIFMTTTVAQGMALSVFLGEWKMATIEAISKLRIGLCLSAVGVIMFMVSVAF